jgi:hypothetical protein
MVDGIVDAVIQEVACQNAGEEWKRYCLFIPHMTIMGPHDFCYPHNQVDCHIVSPASALDTEVAWMCI